MTARLDWFHTSTEIPEEGFSSVRSAREDLRAALCDDLDLLGCSRLDASYLIRPLSQGRYLLTGMIQADVTQSCVVSLEPVESHIEEPFEVEFRPGGPSSGDFDALDIRDIEPLEGGVIPVGRIVYEQFASALDPYPRKEGVQLDTDAVESRGEDDRDNPFDVLKQLKSKS